MARKASVMSVIVVVFALAAGLAGARAITVGSGGGYGFTTIQAAIDNANGGDTVIVYPGTYYENINFLGKAVTVTSTNPADAMGY